MNSKVDIFLTKAKKWQREYRNLRRIALGCELSEELKWGKPCYTFQKRNIILIHGFKKYCAVLFFKGALLKDTEGILVQQTKNVQAARQIRFTSVRDIIEMGPVLKAYIHEAIDVEQADLKVRFRKISEFAIPVELQKRFGEEPSLKTAFEALTPGRQRGYILYFSSAKQSKTRESRIDKYASRILDGIGLNDRYPSKK